MGSGPRARWQATRARAARRTGGPLAAALLLAQAAAGAALEPGAPDARAALARGDAAWERRAEGADGPDAATGPIAEAVAAYEAALAARPDALEAHWKLQRALWFQGDFAADGPAAKRRAYDRAREVAEQAFAALERRLGDGRALDALAPEAVGAAFAPEDRLHVARIHFWSAINWGAWARVHGLFSAVREGVAGRLHRYTQVAVALEPDYLRGGPLRLLSRLHVELPSVPLLTGWVDPDKALPYAERALAIAPDDPGNRYLLALTLLELAEPGSDRFARALGLLEETAALEPRRDMRVEDLAVRADAQKKLRELRSRARAPIA